MSGVKYEEGKPEFSWLQCTDKSKRVRGVSENKKMHSTNNDSYVPYTENLCPSSRFTHVNDAVLHTRCL